MEPEYRYESLAARHNRVDFVSGDADLDRYLKQQAMQHQQKGIAAVFAQVRPGDDTTIHGFYTLSAHTIDATTLTGGVVRGLPKTGLLPAILLGRLAVAKVGQRRGAGSDMLVNATLRAFLTHRDVGAVGVAVRMKREDLFPFYRRMGFVQLPGEPLNIFVSMPALEKVLEPVLAALIAPPVTEREGA